MKVSERRVCRALGQHRSTQRRLPKGRADEERLVADMIELTRQYGRYGYRRVAALLRDAGWQVNDKRVERLWRREGLKVPVSQPKKGRLWMNDGSCVRLRPEYQNHVWSYDFVHHRTDDGRAFRTLNILDEYSRECLAIRVKRKLNSIEVIDALTNLFILRGVPSYIRSDNGPEFIAAAVRDWIKAAGQRLPISSRDRPGRTDTAKASTGECEMNCSTARYSTRCGKPKLLSKDGGTITTPNDPIVHWDIARLRQKPTSRWTKGQSCTNFQIGPLKWGCSLNSHSFTDT